VQLGHSAGLLLRAAPRAEAGFTRRPSRFRTDDLSHGDRTRRRRCRRRHCCRDRARSRSRRSAPSRSRRRISPGTSRGGAAGAERSPAAGDAQHAHPGGGRPRGGLCSERIRSVALGRAEMRRGEVPSRRQRRPEGAVTSCATARRRWPRPSTERWIEIPSRGSRAWEQADRVARLGNPRRAPR